MTLATPQMRQGSLVDLGPDGLGFIIPADSPATFAFTLRRLNKRTFKEAGLHEGDRVVFHIDGAGKVDLVEPVEAL